MGLRKLAKRVLGVQRQPTYYLPWLTRPHLQCALVLSNVESRFKVGYNRGSFPVSVVQYDTDGAVAGPHEVTLPESVELSLPSAPGAASPRSAASESTPISASPSPTASPT